LLGQQHSRGELIVSSKTRNFLIAVAVGIAALLLNQYYVTSQINASGPGDEAVIIRTKKPMPAGTKLSAALIENKRVPKIYVPQLAIRPSNLDAYLGQEVAVDVPGGDYLLETYFSTRAIVGAKLSEQVVNADSRAVTIPVDEINSLSRSLVAGDRIDIVYTFQVPGAPGKMSVMFMQNVPVITTGSYSPSDQELGTKSGAAKRYATVTLMLPVRDAVRLNYARQAGQISILLRSDKDSTVADIPAITGIKDILAVTDRQLVDEAVKKTGVSVEASDQLKEQFRQILEAQRKNQGK
jgi:pilus assembly protein CpaB